MSVSEVFSEELRYPRLPLEPATLEIYAETIRRMIRHEDDVMDQRVTWLCQIQGLLFAALAFAWKEPTAYYLILLLCAVGIVVASASWMALRSVLMSIYRLRLWWRVVELAADYSGPPEYTRVIKLKGWKNRVIVQLTLWNILPLCFCLAWVAVIIIRVWN